MGMVDGQRTLWHFCQLMLTVALQIEEAGLVSLARTFDIVLAFIYETTLLSVAVSWTSILGAVIVITGVCIIALRKYLQAKPEIFARFRKN